jgi:Ca-activated chloride channel family protein
VVARKLRDRGIDLRINVVGLDVSGKARKALQCIARAGGGRYFDAAGSQDLAESMVQVSVRALRLFSLSGEPVTGGTSTADPAEIDPGDYVDRTLAEEAPRFYLVDLPRGGSVSASAVMRPEAGDTVDALRVELLTPDGDRCADDLAQRMNVLGLRSIVGTAAHFDSRVEGLNSEACAAADQLLVAVKYAGPVSSYSLRVRSYPEVANAASLPPAVDPDQRDTWERPVPLTGAGLPVVGGAGLDDAPELEPGRTYSDTLRPREQLIYKVAVKWGQAPRMTARLETDRTADSLQGVLGVAVEAQAFNPLGAQLSETFNSTTGVRGSGFYNGTEPATFTAAQPPVRYRNLEENSSEIRRSALAGYYYFTVEMGGDPDPASEQFQAPVRLAVAVDGEESGAPEYDGEVEGGPTESASAAPRATDRPESTDSQQSAGSVVPWTLVAVAGGVLVTLLALVGGFLLGRRRTG